MNSRQRLSSNQSGQILMMAVLLGVALTIAVTATIFLINTSSSHQVINTQKSVAGSVIDDGIAYAISRFSTDQDTWDNALGGVFPSDCNSGNVVLSPSGSHFKLYCSTGTTGNPYPTTGTFGAPVNARMPSYDVAVTVVATLLHGGTEVPLRAAKVFLNQRTIGIDTTTGIHAAAALQMVRVPSVSGDLSVQWGPIVCLDSATWTLPDPIDTYKYPRKFSAGGVTSNTPFRTVGGIFYSYTRSGLSYGSGPATDGEEYWAYASQNFPTLVDEAYYVSQATGSTSINPPNILGGGSLTASNCASGTTCGYFDTGGGTAQFTGDYTTSATPNNDVVYVKGNAQFDNIAINNATFIITGNLTINASATSNALVLSPPVADAQEYAYTALAGSQFPCYYTPMCADSLAFADSTNTHTQFRGFLYVKGNVVVQPLGGTWNMVGTLVVGDMQLPSTGGQLRIMPASRLNLLYDDKVNHAIHTNPSVGSAIKIVPDVVQTVPSF